MKKPNPYQQFIGGLLLIIVLVFGGIAFTISDVNQFERECHKAGGMVAQPGTMCIKPGAIITIGDD